MYDLLNIFGSHVKDCIRILIVDLLEYTTKIAPYIELLKDVDKIRSDSISKMNLELKKIKLDPNEQKNFNNRLAIFEQYEKEWKIFIEEMTEFSNKVSTKPFIEDELKEVILTDFDPKIFIKNFDLIIKVLEDNLSDIDLFSSRTIPGFLDKNGRLKFKDYGSNYYITKFIYLILSTSKIHLFVIKIYKNIIRIKNKIEEFENMVISIHNTLYTFIDEDNPDHICTKAEVVNIQNLDQRLDIIKKINGYEKMDDMKIVQKLLQDSMNLKFLF